MICIFFLKFTNNFQHIAHSLNIISCWSLFFVKVIDNDCRAHSLPVQFVKKIIIHPQSWSSLSNFLTIWIWFKRIFATAALIVVHCPCLMLVNSWVITSTDHAAENLQFSVKQRCLVLSNSVASEQQLDMLTSKMCLQKTGRDENRIFGKIPHNIMD